MKGVAGEVIGLKLEIGRESKLDMEITKITTMGSGEGVADDAIENLKCSNQADNVIENFKMAQPS